MRTGKLIAALLAVALVVASGPAAKAASPPVAVYPSPGTSYNLPQTQITFRGVPPSAIGPVNVVGSVSGTHTGQIEGDSDNEGGSFLPDKAFTAGETVTVTTGLNIVGGTGGTFSFAIVHPSYPIQPARLPVVPAGSNGLQHFRSRPDLLPPSVTVSNHSAPASEGDIFVAPQFGPSQNGPMILDPQGNLVWFLPFPVSQKLLVSDFREQTYEGQPVLTWFQGYSGSGIGIGEGVIWDRSYEQIAAVHAGNGLQMDLHEFLIASGRNAWIVAVSPVSYGHGIGKTTMDSVVQEIDIKTGLVMFEWHALDHVPLSASYFTPKSPGFVFDPYHLNSITLDRDGNPIISMRNTSAIYKVDRSTGRIIWTLGGKHPSFKMGPGTRTAFQHAAVMQPDGTLTAFDDGAGPPRLHEFARGIRVSLDTTHMTANLVREYDHSPPITTNFEGNVQQLSGGNVFMGWGQQPYFSESNASGQQIFDAHFTVPTSSYRAYRFTWNAQPPTLPALSVYPGSDGRTEAYASWNGATDVAAWRVLGGPATEALSAVGGGARHGFETAIAVRSGTPYFAVQALGVSGNVLATSPVASSPPHLALYGRSAFVSRGGTGAVPASCLAPQPCRITTTVYAGRTLIASTRPEALGENDGGLLYFTLMSIGRSMLARSRGHRLPVQVSVRDASGLKSTTTLNLISFITGGSAPRRSASESTSLRFVGMTDFVSSGRVGGILASCAATRPCHAGTTVSVGNTVIARAQPEFLGARELGYLIFSLTSTGRSMLAHAPGNQLGVKVTITSGTDTASAQIALVSFG